LKGGKILKIAEVTEVTDFSMQLMTGKGNDNIPYFNRKTGELNVKRLTETLKKTGFNVMLSEDMGNGITKTSTELIAVLYLDRYNKQIVSCPEGSINNV